MDESNLLTLQQVANILRVSTQTLRRYMSKGGFPQPVRIGKKGVRWVQNEIVAYMSTPLHQVRSK